MFGFFGGEKLLEWKTPNGLGGGRFAEHPFWISVIRVVLTLCLIFILGFAVILTIRFIFVGGFSLDVFKDVLVVSLGFGILLGVFISGMIIVLGMFRGHVVIREKRIDVRYRFRVQRFRFKNFDYYAFGYANDDVENRNIRYLILANDKDQFGYSIEITSEVEDQMIEAVLEGRLERSDKYGGEINYE